MGSMFYIFKYVHKSEVERIFTERKEKVEEFVQIGHQALIQKQIGDAFRYYYWAHILNNSLPHPEETEITDQNGSTKTFTVWFPLRMNEIFSNLSMEVLSRNNNEYVMGFFYQKEPVANIEFTYFDGQSWSCITQATDGKGVLEMRPTFTPDRFQIQFEYQFLHEVKCDNEIEEIILDNVIEIPTPIGGEVGRVTKCKNAVEDYIEHLLSATDMNFNGYKIALDCANGSSSVSAQEVFIRLGAEVVVLNAEPDGININKDCGSTHMEQLQKCVVQNGCDLGFAFDGDADRMLAVDHTGEVVDGDKCIAVCAKHMKQLGRLKKDTAVVTVMSNMGFFKFCQENGIECEKTKVGDRYVLENMSENGYTIGGEQSGHIIFLEYATTGDGQLSAIQLLSVVKYSGRTLKELSDEMEVYPQVLINVRVSNFGKAQFPKDKEVQNAIKQVEEELGNDGRILVRLSGTEPLVRVMLEGKDLDKIKELGESVAQVVRERLV